MNKADVFESENEAWLTLWDQVPNSPSISSSSPFRGPVKCVYIHGTLKTTHEKHKLCANYPSVNTEVNDNTQTTQILSVTAIIIVGLRWRFFFFDLNEANLSTLF